MKKSMILLLVTLLSTSAFAGSLDLVCEGYFGTIEVKVKPVDQVKSLIEVSHLSPHGYLTKMTNSHKFDKQVDQAIGAGSLTAVVSKSNLQNVFGEMYQEASLVHLTLDKDTKNWTVQLSMNNSVFKSLCTDANN